MKIGNNPEANAPKLERPAARKPEVAVADTPREAAPVRTSTAPEASAQVAISATAAKLSSVGDGTFDAAKVDRIAQAITEGKFTVDARNIANKLIANAQELLGRAKRQ